MSHPSIQFSSRTLFLLTAVAAFFASAWAAGVIVPVALVVGLVLVVFAVLYHLAKPPDTILGTHRTSLALIESPPTKLQMLTIMGVVAVVATINVNVLRESDVPTVWFYITLFAIGWTLAAAKSIWRLIRDRRTIFQGVLCMLEICCALGNIVLSVLLMFVE